MHLEKRMELRAFGAAVALCIALMAAFGFAQSAQAVELDPANLPQGEYTVQASMLNATTKGASVANQALTGKPAERDSKAIDKAPITITVDADRTYTVSLTMHPVTMGTTTAYMKSLEYFTGTDASGAEQYTPAKVDSKYDGVTDRWGTDYPKELSFPLLNKAAGDDADGNFKMQVTVPVIPVNGGVQPALLSIDWASIQQVKGDDPATPTTPTTPEKPAVTKATLGGVTYAVSGKVATVSSVSKKAKSATIRSTVKIGGKNYKVTSIKSKAAYKAKSLKKVTFQGKNLKKIGKNAFRGIAKKATFVAPKSKLQAYKKLVKAAGAPSSAKYKAA